MLFWTLAIALTATACAALYYASARRTVNLAPVPEGDALRGHFRLQLREIDDDVAAGRLGEQEALAARGELAREVMRSEAGGAVPAPGLRTGVVTTLAVLAVAGLALGTYSQIGRPDLPAAPLASRPVSALAGMTLEDAVTRIEAQLALTPDDLRGWRAVGPVYMQLGRFEDAVTAYRRINALAPPTADSEARLAEAIMMTQGGSLEGEPEALLRSALIRDPSHVSARFYLAGEATRTGRFDEAVGLWDGLIASARGDEAWLAAAREGRQAALAGGAGGGPDTDQVRAMVEGLSARLAEGGGSLEEWTQLVRSRLVLGEADKAQAAYEAARAAYPDAGERQALDVLAADNGLLAAGRAP